MKKILFFLFLFLTFNNIDAQYSKKYTDLTKDLKPIDSATIVKKYKNGKVKSSYKKLTYHIGNYEYDVPYGKELVYKKDGSLLYEVLYDKYGNELSFQYFSNTGKITFSAETESIKTKANTTEEVFASYKNQVSIILEKEYFIVEENGEEKMVLWKTGKRRNKKKIGVWKIYNACGKLRKEKSYRD